MHAFVRAIGRVPEPLFRSPALCFLRQFEGGGCTVRFPHLRGVAPQSKVAVAALHASHGPSKQRDHLWGRAKKLLPGEGAIRTEKKLTVVRRCW